MSNDTNFAAHNQLTLGKDSEVKKSIIPRTIKLNAPFKYNANFISRPTTPTSTKYHNIGVQKIREMLRNGGFRTFADFGEHTEHYERTKQEFMQAHIAFIWARIEMSQMTNGFHNWANQQIGPSYCVIEEIEHQDFDHNEIL